MDTAEAVEVQLKVIPDHDLRPACLPVIFLIRKRLYSHFSSDERFHLCRSQQTPDRPDVLNWGWIDALGRIPVLGEAKPPVCGFWEFRIMTRIATSAIVILIPAVVAV